MFDVIVDEVKKYSTNAGKLEAKADKFLEKSDVITIVQVKPERGTVKHASRLNVQRRIHVKHELKQGTSQAEQVKLCRDLPSRSQKLASLRKKLPNLAEKHVSSIFCSLCKPTIKATW